MRFAERTREAAAAATAGEISFVAVSFVRALCFVLFVLCAFALCDSSLAPFLMDLFFFFLCSPSQPQPQPQPQQQQPQLSKAGQREEVSVIVLVFCVRFGCCWLTWRCICFCRSES